MNELSIYYSCYLGSYFKSQIICFIFIMLPYIYMFSLFINILFNNFKPQGKYLENLRFKLKVFSRITWFSFLHFVIVR